MIGYWILLMQLAKDSAVCHETHEVFAYTVLPILAGVLMYTLIDIIGNENSFLAAFSNFHNITLIMQATSE